MVAGAANNQLKEPRHGDALHEMGIVYAPDYVINAGGVINIADELNGYNKERAFKQIGKIYDSITRVLEISRISGIPSYAAADRLAEERIALLRNSRSTFLRDSHHAISRR
ncbi:Leucine dehydrogenase [compost metagenome]